MRGLPTRIALLLTLATGALALPGNGAAAGADVPADPALLAAARPGDVAASERLFAVDLFDRLAAATGGDVAVAPQSVFDVLALLRPGARGGSARALDAALRTSAGPTSLVAGVAALDATLAGASPVLALARAAWLQSGLAVEPDYLGLLSRAGAPPRDADFAADPEAARQAVNGWVAAHTDGRIADLFPEGGLDGSTRLVLASALAFDARWSTPFPEWATAAAPFASPGGTGSVPTMHATLEARYAESPAYQAVELPYAGGRFSALVVLPRAGADPAALAPSLDAIAAGLSDATVALALPRLQVTEADDLGAPLRALGLGGLFDAATADLSGIAGRPGDLVVGTVRHRVWLQVDEAGTRADAATGADVMATAAEVAPPPVTMTVDHPFLLVLHDRVSGLPLLLARVSSPG